MNKGRHNNELKHKNQKQVEKVKVTRIEEKKGLLGKGGGGK